MAREPTSKPKTSRFLRTCRDLALGVGAPILLAWVLAHALHRRLYPQNVRVSEVSNNTYGKVRLRLKLPGTSAGIPEPLISCGITGNASLVFIRLLPKNRAKVGVEFWGLELDQGEEFALPAADAEIDVACDLPALYPGEGETSWGSTPPEVQKLRSHEYVIAVNGVARLRGSVTYTQAPHSPLYFGANPLGGSFVSNSFTGKILLKSQKL
jgi:hypothetical protein